MKTLGRVLLCTLLLLLLLLLRLLLSLRRAGLPALLPCLTHPLPLLGAGQVPFPAPAVVPLAHLHTRGEREGLCGGGGLWHMCGCMLGGGGYSISGGWGGNFWFLLPPYFSPLLLDGEGGLFGTLRGGAGEKFLGGFQRKGLEGHTLLVC